MASDAMERLKALMSHEEMPLRKETGSVTPTVANPQESSLFTNDSPLKHQLVSRESDTEIPELSDGSDKRIEIYPNDHAPETGEWYMSPLRELPIDFLHPEILVFEPDKSLELSLGDESEPGQSFCPVQAVSKLPYKFIDKAHQAVVSKAFFFGGKFWDRQWDIYYIQPPKEIKDSPIFFIPAPQVLTFINQINKELKIGLFFPLEAAEEGFLIEFVDDHTPRPRYLGHIGSRTDFENLKEVMSSATLNPHTSRPEGSTKASREALAAFKEKLDRAIDAGKVKSKAVKEKKKAERVERQHGYIRQIRRTQRYTGLRPRGEFACEKVIFIDYLQRGVHGSTTEILPAQQNTSSTNSKFNTSFPASFEPDGFVVFISVDVEAYERNNNLITEIGISTLDTSELVGVPPGDGCSNWNSKIRPRHFRIQEHSHLRNGAFVEDRADKFEFGESELINLHDAPHIIASCFLPPYSNFSIPPSTIDPNERRALVLVGHDTRNDISYLRRLGLDVTNNRHIVEALDTALMFRALKREPQNRGLGAILFELGLVGWNLHNAGNDATYTLQAMLSIAVQDLTGDHKGHSEAEKHERVEALLQEATQRMQEEQEAWNGVDDEDDGGIPPGVEVPAPSRKEREADAVGGPSSQRPLV